MSIAIATDFFIMLLSLIWGDLGDANREDRNCNTPSTRHSLERPLETLSCFACLRAGQSRRGPRPPRAPSRTKATQWAITRAWGKKRGMKILHTHQHTDAHGCVSCPPTPNPPEIICGDPINPSHNKTALTPASSNMQRGALLPCTAWGSDEVNTPSLPLRSRESNYLLEILWGSA